MTDPVTAAADDLPEVSIRLGPYGPRRLFCPTCGEPVATIEGLSTADVADVANEDGTTTTVTPSRPITLGPCGHRASGLTVKDWTP